MQADGVGLAALVVFGCDDPDLAGDLGGDFLQHRHARGVDPVVVGQHDPIQHASALLCCRACLARLRRRAGKGPASRDKGRRHGHADHRRTGSYLGQRQAQRTSSPDVCLHGAGTDLEMDEAGVDGAVLHPPSWDPKSNEMAIEAAKKYPDKFCILGWFPLDDPAQRKRIETWKQQPGMLGLRWSLTREGQETWHEDGTMDWLWPAAEKAGTPIATMAWRFLPLFGQIAERHPQSETDHRSSGGGPVGAGTRRRLRSWTMLLPLAKLPERGDQGDRCAGLLLGAVSVPGHPGWPAPDL